MEYFLFFIWISIMSVLVYFVLNARKQLRKTLRGRKYRLK